MVFEENYATCVQSQVCANIYFTFYMMAITNELLALCIWNFVRRSFVNVPKLDVWNIAYKYIITNMAKV
jgi:hypothetical protein